MRRGNVLIAVVVGAAALLYTAPAAAAGETTYFQPYCGGADMSPLAKGRKFSTAVDLPYLFARIAEYTLDPGKMYGPNDPWTNWWRHDAAGPEMRESLAKLATTRTILEKENLWDTYRFGRPTPPACPPETKTTRTVNGVCNDLTEWPGMGAAETRFGRNMDPTGSFAQAESPEMMMSPNPRQVSRVLFTRGDTNHKPVPFLNLLGTGWIQFQVHDWFNHRNSILDFWQVPLDKNDPIAQGREFMLVQKTLPDSSRGPHEAAMGPTYQNEVTHWWDLSQLYGSDVETANSFRARDASGNLLAKLEVDANGLLPAGSDGFAKTGFRNNWWLGLAVMHHVFALEHNAIVDRLAAVYPTMSQQQLFDKARMINAALVVKIHTVDWTTQIIPHPALQIGMNVNWGGLNQYMDPPLAELPSFIPLPYRHVIFGIRGGARALHNDPKTGQQVPFSLTEEFVSVYRMHTLLPDYIDLYSVDGVSLRSVKLKDSRNADARRVLEKYGLRDVVYSFGLNHSGQLVLNNYPEVLQQIKTPFGIIDIGAIDVLRDRERGVPRYNEFRRQLNLMPLHSIDELTSDPVLNQKLKDVYGHDAGAIERVDALVGTLAEQTRPDCYGFGETLFQVFIVMASRRLHADRFFTESYNADSYTQAGLDWIEANNFTTVLLRHFPEFASTDFIKVQNSFYPWYNVPGFQEL